MKYKKKYKEHCLIDFHCMETNSNPTSTKDPFSLLVWPAEWRLVWILYHWSEDSAHFVWMSSLCVNVQPKLITVVRISCRFMVKMMRNALFQWISSLWRKTECVCVCVFRCVCLAPNLVWINKRKVNLWFWPFSTLPNKLHTHTNTTQTDTTLQHTHKHTWLCVWC